VRILYINPPVKPRTRVTKASESNGSAPATEEETDEMAGEPANAPE
jgi:hypothetical protein